jgi:3-oxoacyl-[acyl-carrier protein] reductase
MANLEGKAAVVTGGTRGIGRAIVEVLLGAGASVVVGARTEADLRATVEDLGDNHPGRVDGAPCDVRRPEQCRALVERAVDRFGRLDVLVNNAGVGRFTAVEEMSDEVWKQQLETNLDGVFYCSRAAIPHLKRSGDGWIVNVGSLAGKNAFAGGAAYNASKFGLIGFTEALMAEVRHDGIRVTCVMPGSVATDFRSGDAADWKLQAEDVARVVGDLLAFPARALPSRVEIRPTRPPRK